MGFMDSLKAQLLKDEKSEPKDKAGAGSAPSSASSSQGSVFAGLAGVGTLQSSSPVPIPRAEVDQKFYSTLSSAMNSVPTPGLAELSLTADGLVASGIPPDKVSQIALNVLGKKGITLAQINDELAKRLAALDGENTQLLGMADRQYTIDVGGKENQMASIDQQVLSLEQKMAELESKRAELLGQKANLQAEMIDKKNTIESKKAGLMAAYEKLKAETLDLQGRVSS